MKRLAGLLLATAALILPAGASFAADAPRVVSMNVCTDQLLLSLADPGQILGLSRFARDRWQSFAAVKAQTFPVLSGGAEDVLMLKPDVVVASLFDKRATRELLKARGVNLAEFSLPQNLDEVKAQIGKMGDITGHPDRAAAEIARLDLAAARAREAAGARHDRALALSRRGWVSGRDSLIGSLLEVAGLRNAADDLGIASGGYASLEAIIASRPDLLLVSEADGRAEDEGKAFLLHPALEHFYPADRRIVIPEQLTVCGGAMLADALDLLLRQLAQVTR
jgi:iron complex transport system substrate-binding protein